VSRNSQGTERRPLETKDIRSTTNVGFQLEDALTEYTSRVLSRSVRSHLLYEAPSEIGFIWFTLGTRNIDHFVSLPRRVAQDTIHQCAFLFSMGHCRLMSMIVSILSTLSTGRERRTAEATPLRAQAIHSKLAMIAFHLATLASAAAWRKLACGTMRISDEYFGANSGPGRFDENFFSRANYRNVNSLPPS
jgi:hypothetical protein